MEDERRWIPCLRLEADPKKEMVSSLEDCTASPGLPRGTTYCINNIERIQSRMQTGRVKRGELSSDGD
jgi:hypothetical protein